MNLQSTSTVKQPTVASSKKLAGWIFRSVKTTEAKAMMTLFIALILSRVECFFVLTSPFKAGEILVLEYGQTPFTARVDSQISELLGTTESNETTL